MTAHDPYSCAECDRLGWYHADGEEPFDLTEHATAATGSWLTALVIVAALFGAVLLAWRWLK